MNCSKLSRDGKSEATVRYWLGREIRTGFYMLIACIILISIFACATLKINPGTTSNTSNQQTANSSSQNNPSSGSNVNSSVQPDTTPAPAQASPTPPSPPAPAQQTTPPSQPAGGNANVPSGTQTIGDVMIRKDACTMVLTKDDMGEGWMSISTSPPTLLYTSSKCHVYYAQGGSFAPSVQNTVAVFRTLQAASDAYDKEKPAYATISNPGIGNESFLNESTPINRELVFRKGNVVVYLWLQQYQTGDIEHYARVVEQRITP
ncbi:MAG: hypothetical protein ACYDHZ_10820 [Dehalococcoidia bacterium]